MGSSIERVASTRARARLLHPKTTFEIVADNLGAQNALLGGRTLRRHLVKRLGGPERAGIGFAAGLERLVLAMPESGPDGSTVDAFVVAIGDDARVHRPGARPRPAARGPQRAPRPGDAVSPRADAAGRQGGRGDRCSSSVRTSWRGRGHGEEHVDRRAARGRSDSRPSPTGCERHRASTLTGVSPHTRTRSVTDDDSSHHAHAHVRRAADRRRGHDVTLPAGCTRSVISAR